MIARVRVELLEGRETEDKRALLRALHATLPNALGVPEEELTLRLVEHPREQFTAPAGDLEHLIVVVISAFVRSDATRERVRESVERAAVGFGARQDDVLVRWTNPVNAV